MPARVTAWVDACRDLLGATTTPAGAGDANGEQERFLVAVPRPDTCPLLVVIRGVDGLPVAELGMTGQSLRSWPHCGCDACDDGSQYLLDGIDDWFTDMLTGEAAAIWGEGFHATRSRHGVATSTSADAPVTLDHETAQRLLDALAAGRPVELPAGLQGAGPGNWLG